MVASFPGRATTPRAARTRAAPPVSGPLENLLRDDDALDLRSSLVDLEHLGVAHQLLDGILARESVSAEHLHGVQRRLHRGVGAERLRERRLLGVGAARLRARRLLGVAL